MKLFSLSRAAAVAVAAALPVLAHAEVPAGATALMTSIATDFGTLLTAGYVLMLAILGGFIVMRLVQKVTNRASS